MSKFASCYGLALAAVCTLIALVNNLGLNGSPLNLWAVGYFLFAVLLGLYSRTVGLSILIFLLPLTPTFNKQLALLIPWLEAQRTLSGNDLIAGFVVGAVLRWLMLPIKGRIAFTLPPAIGIFSIILTASVILAINRNLWQAASIFSFSGLLFNVTHITHITWKDDFYPLVDLMSYGLAIAFFACALQILKTDTKAQEKIFKPLLWSVIVSALWAIFQAKTGLGSVHPGEVNKFFNGLGFIGAGFQPDLHAFSGLMLLGAVGALGCFLLTENKISRLLITTAIISGWIGLIISSSRGSMILALLFYCLLGVVLIWRQNKKYFYVMLGFSIVTLLAVYFLHFKTTHILPVWMTSRIDGLSALLAGNNEALNIKLGYRPEIFQAALRMFDFFPIMGLGQGSFNRMSGVAGFSESKLLLSLGGENAHNYFLQRLTETGLVGFVSLAAVVLVPVMFTQSRKALFPVLMMLIAFGLGNLYAHSLLVRVNLFLLAGCLALLYVMAQASTDPALESGTQELSKLWGSKRMFWVVVVCVVLITILAGREIYASFNRFPYQYGLLCHEPKALKTGDWSPGRMLLSPPKEAVGLELVVRNVQPNVDRAPLFMTVAQSQPPVSAASGVIRYYFSAEMPQTVHVYFESLGMREPSELALTLSRCFTPKNLGVNTDSRRLGVVIDSYRWKTN